jgi:sialate O-acetylesterase
MDNWSPDLKDRSGKTMYSATIRRIWKNGGHVAGIIWYQGCSDTGLQEHPLYTDKMVRMISEFRKDLKNPALPFVAVQLATLFNAESVSPNWPTTTLGWNSVREQQRLLPKRIKNLAVVPAVDLPLNDPIHLNGEGQNRLGARLAEAAWTLRGGPRAQKPPIALKSIKLIKGLWMKIEVTFDNVMGNLQAQGRPYGFTLAIRKGIAAHLIYRTELSGNKAILYTDLLGAQGCDVDLYYGYSPAAYCNITDEGGRSLPTFGPFQIISDQGAWDVLDVRRTALLPGAGKLHSVSCPDIDEPSLGWKDQSFGTAFWNLHKEIEPNKDDKMLFYHLPFQCDEAMKLVVGLGYDGPIRVWLDKKEILFDPKGINPMILDQKKIKVDASAGRHDLVVAFSTNFGQAWGIGVKIYRKDIPAALLKKGKEFYKMPHAVE